MSKFTIKISATLNGKACKNPQVEFIQGAGCIYPCEIKDNEITIETLPGSTDCNCIEGYIKCEDECLNCPPQHFKKCFCDTTDDCQDCETCIGGLCQSDCPDKLCINDTCCDCAVTEDCPKGFVCNGCGCNCIGSINSDGECVQCKTKGDCKACENCIDGKCVPLECPNNLTCVNGGCGCPAGTKYDPVTNSCIPIVCNDDRECGSCETCLSNNCVPINCPAGTKAVITNGVCTCIEWPCVDVTCENGADCGVGCGCKDGECVPCKYLLCNTDVADDLCTRALGCECDAAQKCKAVGGCGQYCDGFNPCNTPGCTCYENTCVACENFSCDNGECAEKVGCTCKNGKCEAKGCNNEPCSSTANCGVGCVCENGQCVDGPCSGSCSDSSGCAGENCICVDGQCEQSPDGCKDSFTLVKNCGSGDADCKLTATLTTKGCPCDPITFKINNKATYTNGTVTGLLLGTEAFKGIAAFKNYKTEPTFGDNELLSGEIDVNVEVFKSQGGALVTTTTTTITPSSSNTFADKLIDTSAYKALGYYVVVTLTARGFKTESNACAKYGDEVIGSYVVDYTSKTGESNSAVASKIQKEEKITDKISSKKPLFTWSKTSKENFRKIYPEGSSGTYTDIIDSTTKGVTIGDSYTVKTDCAGCTSPVASLPSVEFCCTDYVYELTNCRTKLVFDKPSFCEPVRTQTKQYLEISTSDGNTEKVELSANITREYVGKSVTGLKVYFTVTSSGKNVCGEDLDLGPDDILNPDVKVDCDYSDTQVKITITAEPGDLITKVEFDKGNISTQNSPSGASSVIVYADKTAFITAGAIKAKITFKTGCFAERILPTCESKLILTPTNGVQDCTSGPNKGTITGTVSGFKSGTGNNIVWTINTTPAQSVTTTSSTNVFANLPSGSYTVTASQGGKTLQDSATVIVNDVIKVKYTASATSLCGSATASISVTTEPPTSGISLQLTNLSGSVGLPVTTAAAGIYTFTGISTANTYSVVATKSGATLCQGTPIVITKESRNLTPNVEIGETCLNVATAYNIQDSFGVQYVVTAVGGTIADGKYTPTSATGPYQIVLSLPTGSCDVITSGATTTVTVKAAPIIQKAVSGCVPNTYTGLVDTIISGAASVYLLSSQNVQTNLVNTSGNNWSVQSIPINAQYTLVAVGANGCKATRTVSVGSCTSCDDTLTFNLSYTPTCASAPGEVRSIYVMAPNTGIPASGTLAWYTTASSVPIQTAPYGINNNSSLGLTVSASFNSPANIYAVITYSNGVESCTITSPTIEVKPSVSRPLDDGEPCNPNADCQCLNNNCIQNPSNGLYYCGCVENAVCPVRGEGDPCTFGGDTFAGDCGNILCGCDYPFNCIEATPGNWICSSQNNPCGTCGALAPGGTAPNDCVCNGGVGCEGGFNGCEENYVEGLKVGCKCIF